jgi:outer membrane protein
MNFLTIFLTAIFFIQSAKATNLNDAIDIAKANNKNIKFEDYKLEATKSLKSEARGAFLPSLSASGQYGQRKSNSGSNANNYNSNQVEELKVEQPLFDGFGSIAKYNEADYKVQSATTQNHSRKQEITFEAVRSYCDLFRHQEIVKIHRKNIEVADQISELAKIRKKGKFIDESDSIKFQYELENTRTKQFEAESKLLKAKFEYRNIVGELHENLTVPTIKEEKFDERKTVELALTNNQNLKSYRLNYLASKSAYSAEKSAFAPSVSMVGSVSRQKNPLYLSGQDISNRSVYVNVSVPIFQKGVEYSNLSKASNQSSAAREELEVNKSELIKNVGQSIQEYNFYLKMNRSNEELFNLAQSRVEILTKRVSAGAEDVIELLRAKIELNSRKIDLINAQMDLVTTHYKIKFLTGEI